MHEMTLPGKNRYGFYGDFEISGDGSMEWRLQLCTMENCGGVGHTAEPVAIRVWEEGGKWFLRNETKDEPEPRKVHEFPNRDAALMFFGYIIHSACNHVTVEISKANLLSGAVDLLNKWGFSL